MYFRGESRTRYRSFFHSSHLIAQCPPHCAPIDAVFLNDTTVETSGALGTCKLQANETWSNFPEYIAHRYPQYSPLFQYSTFPSDAAPLETAIIRKRACAVTDTSVDIMTNVGAVSWIW